MNNNSIQKPNLANKAEVTREVRANNLQTEGAQVKVREAGRMLQLPQSKYLGSVTIHYYENGSVLDMDEKYSCQTQLTDIGNVSEGHADFGWKEARRALMRAFGREVPKKRGER
jgi:hypothetical protein